MESTDYTKSTWDNVGSNWQLMVVVVVVWCVLFLGSWLIARLTSIWDEWWEG